MIAFGSALSGGSNGGGVTGPFTFTGPTISGSNTIGFVSAFGGDGSDVVTGITWGGVAMTFIGKVKASGVNHYSYLYCIVNPSSAATISIAYTGSHFMSGGAIYYTGAAQTGQPDANNTATAAGTSLTASLTTVADNCWTVMVAASNTGTSDEPAAGTGTTERTNAQVSWNLYDSNGAISPAGSTSLAVTSNVSGVEAVIASFAPAASSTTYARAASLSMMNDASRYATAQRVWQTARSAAVTMMNAAARYASVVFHLPVHFARSASVTMMNASSRYATAVAHVTVVWVRTASVTMMNAASRFASATKSFIIKIGSTIRWNFFDWD